MVKKQKTEQTEFPEGEMEIQQGEGTGAEERTAEPGDKAAASGAATPGEGPSRLAEAERKAAENYDRYVRAVAELDNYKKRAIREKAEAIRYGNEALLRDILPLMDNMDRALGHACNSDDFAAFKEGLRLLKEQLQGCLVKHGVEPIEAAGKPFDPNVHEAMVQVDSEAHEESRVVDEFERGYLLNGRLLRPAKVSVCRRAKKDGHC